MAPNIYNVGMSAMPAMSAASVKMFQNPCTPVIGMVEMVLSGVRLYCTMLWL